MKPLTIWLMHHGEPVPVSSQDEKFRSHRLATELSRRGHKVTYWCSTFEHHKKKLFSNHTTAIEIGNYSMMLLHAGEYGSNHSIGRLLHHHRMARLFARNARLQPQPDLILCSLPIHYCAFQAVKFGRSKGIPVIIDIRDYWPDTLLLALPQYIRRVGEVLLAYDRFQTRFALKNATAVVSMMKNLLEWGLNNYADRSSNANDRIFYIGGDEPKKSGKDDFKSLFPEFPLDQIENKLVVNYIGTFTALTHPLELIRAAKTLRSEGFSDKIVFVLAGKGDWLEKCRMEADGLRNVFFPGWLNSAQVNALNSISSIGVLPSYEQYSFPNKTFAYLSCGLPILSSEQGDLKSLLEKYNAGYYFDINQSGDLAKKIKHLLGLETYVFQRLRANARELFCNELQAGKIYRDYADYLEKMAVSAGNHG